MQQVQVLLPEAVMVPTPRQAKRTIRSFLFAGNRVY